MRLCQVLYNTNASFDPFAERLGADLRELLGILLADVDIRRGHVHEAVAVLEAMTAEPRPCSRGRPARLALEQHALNVRAAPAGTGHHGRLRGSLGPFNGIIPLSWLHAMHW